MKEFTKNQKNKDSSELSSTKLQRIKFYNEPKNLDNIKTTIPTLKKYPSDNKQKMDIFDPNGSPEIKPMLFANDPRLESINSNFSLEQRESDKLISANPQRKSEGEKARDLPFSMQNVKIPRVRKGNRKPNKP